VRGFMLAMLAGMTMLSIATSFVLPTTAVAFGGGALDCMILLIAASLLREAWRHARR